MTTSLTFMEDAYVHVTAGVVTCARSRRGGIRKGNKKAERKKMRKKQGKQNFKGEMRRMMGISKTKNGALVIQ